jgi:adenine-specific DNA-methyltransferase
MFLLGVLNSKVTAFFHRQQSSTIQQDFLRFIAIYLKNIPIPEATATQRATIESLVRKLLAAGGQGPQVEVWEQELNALVYDLYGLTEAETSLVEGTRLQKSNYGKAMRNVDALRKEP